jgi:hypothetical protein
VSLPCRYQGVVMLSLVVVFLAAGCAVDSGKVYVKDGKRYGVTASNIWRGRWWNYYERGLYYLSLLSGYVQETLVCPICARIIGSSTVI